jgi:hypothetical protein
MRTQEMFRFPTAVSAESSPDITPESSDVEDENYKKFGRRKRAKKQLTEEETNEHLERSRVFPLFTETLRVRLASEHNGQVNEQIAVTALIEEFVGDLRTVHVILSEDCERWMREAAEYVEEQRSSGRQRMRQRKYLSTSAAAAASAAGQPSDKAFRCTLCPVAWEAKSFKTLEGLNLHIRNKHEKDKKWICRAPSCGVSFVRQADLRMHLIRMHSEVRPFPCKIPFCVKSFAGISELRRHIKVEHVKLVRDICGTTPIKLEVEEEKKE